MSQLPDAGKRSRRPLRLAVIVAALGVAACFTAAFTFSHEPVQASEVEQTR